MMREKECFGRSKRGGESESSVQKAVCDTEIERGRNGITARFSVRGNLCSGGHGATGTEYY